MIFRAHVGKLRMRVIPLSETVQTQQPRSAARIKYAVPGLHRVANVLEKGCILRI